MKKLIYTITALTLCTIVSAQSQQKTNKASHKGAQVNLTNKTSVSEESNPSKLAESSITYSVGTAVPSKSLDPTIIPYVSEVEPKKTEHKKENSKSNPK